MSHGPETTFIQSVHKHLPTDLYRLKNNNQFHAGIADCWYSGNLGDIWIEFKYVVLPARPKTDIKVPEMLSALQVDWLARRHEEGRKVFVVVGSKDGGVWFEDRDWEHYITAEAFRSAIEDRKQIAQRICSHTYG